MQELESLLDKLNNLLVQFSVPVKAAEAQAAVRLAAEMIAHRAVETAVLPAAEITVLLAAVTTAQPAAEARPQTIPVQYPHAENSAPRAAVKSQVVARLAAGITAQLAVVRPAVEWAEKRPRRG